MTERKADNGKRVSHARHAFTVAQPRWMLEAVCRGTDVSLWFPISDKSERIDEAKDICAYCPVIADCLQWAYDTDSWDGIFGGQTGTERRKARRNAQRRRHNQKVAS